jgi:hypothetical protein
MTEASRARGEVHATISAAEAATRPAAALRTFVATGAAPTKASRAEEEGAVPERRAEGAVPLPRTEAG